MTALRPLLLATLVAMFACAEGQAAFVINVNLSIDQEVPSLTPLDLKNSSTLLQRPTSSGTATFTLDISNPNSPFLTFTATIFNIDVTGLQTPNDSNDNLVAAHIHAGPTAIRGSNASVVWGFFGSPFNDNNPNDAVMTPFSTGVGGTFSGKWDAPEGNNTTLPAQLAEIMAGHAYINFHTTQFGTGEIRGFFTPFGVPEPSSLVLLGIGTTTAAGWGWRSRKRTR